ncbi:MAG: hypothetical protein ABIJ96_13205 [Elusimicrobiota bacterium]
MAWWASGLAIGQFKIPACFILLLLGWLFVPYYLKTGVFTMPMNSPKRRSDLDLISFTGETCRGAMPQ